MELNLKVISKDISLLLWGTGKTICTAESCSAGRVAAMLTTPAGSSTYFKGGLVCYADELKEKLLGVSPELIAEQTAVSEEVARQMATGALQLFGCDFSVAVTGFAGPGGGTAENPVGTVWVAVASGKRVVTQKVFNDLGRDGNVELAVEAVSVLLRDFLKEELGKK